MVLATRRTAEYITTALTPLVVTSPAPMERVSSDEFTVTWLFAATQDQYRIQIYEEATGATLLFDTEWTLSTFQTADLEVGSALKSNTVYYLKVYAHGLDGEEGESVLVPFYFALVPLFAYGVSGLAARADPGCSPTPYDNPGIRLTWDAVAESVTTLPEVFNTTDDGSEAVGGAFSTAVCYCGRAAGVTYIGFLRLQVSVPQGASIVNASLKFGGIGVFPGGAPESAVYAQETWSSLQPSNPGNLPSNMTLTSQFTPYVPVGSALNVSIDVTQIVQHLVNLALWQSDNWMTFLFKDTLGLDNNAFQISENDDGFPTVLSVTYLTGSPAVGFVAYEILRREAGTSDPWMRIARITDISTTRYFDVNIVPGVEYEYVVVAYIDEGSGYYKVTLPQTSPVSARTDFDWIYIHDTSDPTRFFRAASFEGTVKPNLDIAYAQPFGQSRPAAFVGEAFWHTISISGFDRLRRTPRLWSTMREMFQRQSTHPSTLCVRFGLDRELYFVAWNQFAKRLSERSYVEDIDLTEVEYCEEIAMLANVPTGDLDIGDIEL